MIHNLLVYAIRNTHWSEAPGLVIQLGSPFSATKMDLGHIRLLAQTSEVGAVPDAVAPRHELN